MKLGYALVLIGLILALWHASNVAERRDRANAQQYTRCVNTSENPSALANCLR